ncbi:MAG: hypothetical protein ACLP1D_10865 [Xanthobacteraceae bacterium]
MSVDTMRLQVVGERPLLMNSSAKVDPLNPAAVELSRMTSKRDKTAADHEYIAKLEWHAGIWLADGKPCIPSSAIEAAFNAAARTRRKGKQAKAGLCCFVSPLLEYDGPGDLSAMWSDKAFVFRTAVNVNGSKVMRTRPRFNDWRAAIDVVFVPSLLNRNEVREFFEIAGFREGLGDWRPKFGKFSVKEID